MSESCVTENVMIRKMELNDIAGVMEVDRKSFPLPWPESILRKELLENHFAAYYVMVINKRIIGYVGLWMVLDDAQITNIAVTPEYRGKKLGQQLFLHAIEEAIGRGMSRLSLEVRVSNLPAQRMYEKFGLVPGGIRKNYYTDNGEDAIVMWVDLV